MQGQVAISVPQRPVRYRIENGRSVGVSGKRGKGAVGAPALCAPAFLTATIEDIRPEGGEAATGYGINVRRSYDKLEKVCQRFMKYADMSYDFQPKTGSTLSQQLGQLIAYFENELKKLGLDFYAGMVNARMEKVDELQYAVYRFGHELEDMIIVIYASPADYLSPKGSELYKRFLKFYSSHTFIDLGNNNDNLYIDSTIEWWCDGGDEWDAEENDEEHKKYIEDRKNRGLAYKKDGKFWKLFKEIESLECDTSKKLLADLEAYRNECPPEESDLVESMMEGVPIVEKMNKYWFEFDPLIDGMEDDYGNIDGDGHNSSVMCSAILYSEQDGLGEALIDCVNNDAGCGIVFSGWNIHQYLYPGFKKSALKEFMECKDLARDIDNWICKFNTESGKFDLYGKSERIAG